MLRTDIVIVTRDITMAATLAVSKALKVAIRIWRNLLQKCKVWEQNLTYVHVTEITFKLRQLKPKQIFYLGDQHVHCSPCGKSTDQSVRQQSADHAQPQNVHCQLRLVKTSIEKKVV